MNLVIPLGNDPFWRRSRALGIALRTILEGVAQADLLYLTHHHVPLLYESGVRYKEEPKQQGFEEFAPLHVVYQRGFGDCDDLAPIRVAELRKRGEKASIRVQWKKQPSGKLYHIIVRRSQQTPVDPAYMIRLPDGSVLEDPSRRLGMGRKQGI